MSLLDTAVAEAQKVCKKQKTCEAKVDSHLQELIQLVTEAKARMDDPSASAEQVLAELGRRIEEAGPLRNAVSQTKELHSAVGKLGKVGFTCACCWHVWAQAHACMHSHVNTAWHP